MKTEWAIFRKTDPIEGEAPMENWTFESREKTERVIAKFFNTGPDWLEARSREVSEWTKGSHVAK